MTIWRAVTHRALGVCLAFALLLAVPATATAMQQHLGYLKNTTGDKVGGATVTVYLASDGVTLASLYIDNGATPKPNPFTTDIADGSYRFYAKNGRYKLVFAKTGLTFDATDTADVLLFDPNDPLNSLNVKSDCGAVGDGGTNDGPAFQACFDAAGVGTRIYVPWPSVSYLIATPIILRTVDGVRQGVTLECASMETKIKSGLTAGETMLTINSQRDADGTLAASRQAVRVTVRNCQFVGRKGLGSGEAILVRLNFPLMTVFENVHLRDGYGTGLHVGRPQSFTFLGGGTGNHTLHGIHFSTDEAGSSSGQGSRIANCSIKSASGVGVLFEAGSEHSMVGCQVESNAVGVEIRRSRHFITENVFENNDINLKIGDAVATVDGIYVDRNVLNLQSGTTSGVTVENHDGVYFDGNALVGGGETPFILGTPKGSKVSYVRNTEGPRTICTAPNTPANCVWYVTATNPSKWAIEDVISPSLPSFTASLAANSATPSVLGARRFETANTAPTSITEFLNCYSGKHFDVRVADGNTTFVHGSPLQLQGGSNIVAASGDRFFFSCATGTAAGATAVAYHVATLDGSQFKTLLRKQTLTVAADGAGTAAAADLTPTRPYIEIDCQDTDGCNITMKEASALEGELIRIVNISANTVNFADTGAVSELAGAFAAGQWDSITMVYEGTRWVETSRSNN